MHPLLTPRSLLLAMILGMGSLYYVMQQNNTKSILLSLSSQYSKIQQIRRGVSDIPASDVENVRRYLDKSTKLVNALLSKLGTKASNEITNSSVDLSKIHTLYPNSNRYDIDNSLRKENDQPQDLEWLDREEGKKFSGYGDNTCGINTDREHWQKMLRKWTKLAEKLKIRYFLTAGSLLGAWRNEDAIPYDQDVDLRIHIDDFEKLYPLRQRKFIWDAYDDYECHFYFTRDWRLPYDKRRRFTCMGQEVFEYEGQCSFTDPNARMIFRQWHFDLYAYTTYSDIVKFIPNDEPHEFQKNDIFPLTRCMFMEIETRCPNKPRVILDKLYHSLVPYRICQNTTWIRK